MAIRKIRNIRSILGLITGLTVTAFFVRAGEPTPMRRYQVQMVDGKHSAESVQLRGDENAINVELHEIMANFVYPSGKKGKAKVIVLYEPKNGAYWWTISQKERFLKEYRVFFVRKKIVGMHFIDSPPRIIVEEKQQSAATLSDVVNAVAAEIERMIPKSEGGYFRLGREINLFQALGLEFYRTNPPSADFGPAQFQDANWADNKWLVHLKGPSKIDATVILSEEYEVEGSTKRQKK